MALDKATDAGSEWFAELLPGDPDVSQRKMFGNVAGFVNGNMFLYLHGDDIAVRHSPGDRSELRSEGGTPFAPTADRPMKEYVALPDGGDVDAAAPLAGSVAHLRPSPACDKEATTPTRSGP